MDDKEKREFYVKNVAPVKHVYHEAISAAWLVYDKAVAPARAVLDAVDEPTDSDWDEFNRATLPARRVLETSIRPARIARDKAMMEFKFPQETKA